MKIFTRPNVLRGIFALTMAGALVILGLAACTLSGCATATVDAPVCDSESVNLGTTPSGHPAGSLLVTLPPAPVQFNLSDALKKVSDVADSVQVTVNGLTIDNTTHDLDWIRAVSVTATGSAMDGSTPETPFASGQWSGNPGTSLGLTVIMPGDTVLHYLQSGQVTLNITVTGDVSAMSIPPGTQLNNTVTLCVDTQGTVSKSL